MKFAIDLGHNVPGKDTGAIGYQGVREDDLIKQVGQKLIKLLTSAGHQVIETAPTPSTPIKDDNESLGYRCKVANQAQADVFISIHFNAFNKNAYGAEVFAVSRIGQGIGTEILKEICDLGFRNRRGRAVSANFYVLKQTNMPAVLIECCFCDNKGDMKRFDADKMAHAIALGLIGDVAPVDNDPVSIEITDQTWLKDTTEQSSKLSDEQKDLLATGRYEVLAMLPEEEGHYFIRLNENQEGFVFVGHCNLIDD